MCNRYKMTADLPTLGRTFGLRALALDAELPQSELFHKRRGVVVREVAGQRHLSLMIWGVPPPKSGSAPVTNIRNLASGFWRRDLGIPSARCLVPVTSFCEWEGSVPGSKIARWFNVVDRELFAFAGLWRPGGGELPHYAFLTCEPNPLVAPVHPKAMPVILHEADYDRWLTGSPTDVAELAVPFPSQLMSID